MRTVLIGIDPGRNDGEPFSPKYPSGNMLAEFAGMTPERFLLSFDRINLHYNFDVHQMMDDPSVKNMMSILRGRRVITLGRRVSFAFKVINDWMTWEMKNGFVVSPFPHPSLRNHYWNNPLDREKAKRFFFKATRPCVHVEGVDGSGKSTLVDYIKRNTELEVLPTQDPPRTWEECIKRIKERILPGIVCDRSSGLISELVYGPVIRNSTVAEEDVIWEKARSLIHAVTFIYCRPPVERISPNFRKGEDPVHVAQVKKRLPILIEKYDEVMTRLCNEGARVIHYDWTNRGADEVMQCVG